MKCECVSVSVCVRACVCRYAFGISDSLVIARNHFNISSNSNQATTNLFLNASLYLNHLCNSPLNLFLLYNKY